MERGREIVNPVIFPSWRRMNKSVYRLERESTQQRVEMIVKNTSTNRRRADATQTSIRVYEHHTIAKGSKNRPEDTQSLVPPREATIFALIHWSMQNRNGTLENGRGNRTNETSRVRMSHRDFGGCNATRDRDPQFASKVTPWGISRRHVKESGSTLRTFHRLTKLCLKDGRSRRLTQTASSGMTSFRRDKSQNV